MTLQGRVALVTGASQGIGKACAESLAQAGAAVVAAARNQEKLAELVSKIKAAGGQSASLVVDVTDEEQVKSTQSSRRWDNSARSTSWSTTPVSPATNW